MEKTVADWRHLLKFTYDKEGIIITGFKEETPKCLTIPAQIGKRPVVSIKKYAFENFGGNKLIIQDGVKEIGAYAFANSKIEEVQIPLEVSFGEGVFEKCCELADDMGDIIVNGCWFGNVKHEYKFNDTRSLDHAFYSKYPIYSELCYLPEMTYTGEKSATTVKINLRRLKKGDIFEYGYFPQSKHAELQPIEWKVVQKDRFFLNAVPVSLLCDTLFECDNPEKRKKVDIWLNEVVRPIAFTQEENDSIISFKTSFFQERVEMTEKNYKKVLNTIKSRRLDATEYVIAQTRERYFQVFHINQPADIMMKLKLI